MASMDSTCITLSILLLIGSSGTSRAYFAYNVCRIHVEGIPFLFPSTMLSKNWRTVFRVAPRVSASFPFEINRVYRYVTSKTRLYDYPRINWFAYYKFAPWRRRSGYINSATLAICQLFEIDYRRGNRESIEYHSLNVTVKSSAVSSPFAPLFESIAALQATSVIDYAGKLIRQRLAVIRMQRTDPISLRLVHRVNRKPADLVIVIVVTVDDWLVFAFPSSMDLSDV